MSPSRREGTPTSEVLTRNRRARRPAGQGALIDLASRRAREIASDNKPYISLQIPRDMRPDNATVLLNYSADGYPALEIPSDPDADVTSGNTRALLFAGGEVGLSLSGQKSGDVVSVVYTGVDRLSGEVIIRPRMYIYGPEGTWKQTPSGNVLSPHSLPDISE